MKRMRMKPDPHSRLERTQSSKDRIARQLVRGRNSLVDICMCQGETRELSRETGDIKGTFHARIGQ